MKPICELYTLIWAACQHMSSRSRARSGRNMNWLLASMGSCCCCCLPFNVISLLNTANSNQRFSFSEVWFVSAFFLFVCVRHGIIHRRKTGERFVRWYHRKPIFRITHNLKSDKTKRNVKWCFFPLQLLWRGKEGPADKMEYKKQAQV